MWIKFINAGVLAGVLYSFYVFVVAIGEYSSIEAEDISDTLILQDFNMTETEEIIQETLFTYAATAEGEAVITGCSMNVEEIVIPLEINGIPVVGISENAFMNRNDIRKVDVKESGVRYIMAGAFAGCTQLEEIELNEKLQYIGDGAFLGDAALKEARMPDSVLYIGEGAFRDCKELGVIEFPQTAHVDAYAFEGSAWQDRRDGQGLKIRGSELVGITDCGSDILEVPYGITAIGEDLEKNSQDGEQGLEYEEIHLPDTLTELGMGCFKGAQIGTIRIPSGVRQISREAFAEADIGEIGLPHGLEVIEKYAFVGAGLGEIALPDTLQVIEDGAFMDCGNLQKITIPGSVCFIADSAFGSCNSLTEVIFEEGIEALDIGAFSHCENLERLQLPESLKYIEGETFSYAMQRMYIPSGTTEIGERVFRAFQSYGHPITVYGQRGSRAEEVAADFQMNFVEAESGDEMP